MPARARTGAGQRRTVMPWSIVPYISILPPRSPVAPAPPCAQAAQMNAAANMQKIVFIVASRHMRRPVAAASGHSTRGPRRPTVRPATASKPLHPTFHPEAKHRMRARTTLPLIPLDETRR
uniref:Uncharacterized protein n=1 Tax=Burkholderia orbicola (strain AU 1054) TaxID=331271 RepID=A0A0H2XM21_BURO1